jgi:hypothetical protein
MALVALVVGGTSGLVVGMSEFYGVIEYFEPVSRQPTAESNKRRTGEGPRVVVEGGPKHEFETIAFGASDEREKYHELGVPPGESIEVVVKYGARKPGDTFNEQAYFRTNDPLLSYLRFDITGAVTQAAKVIPAELTLGSVSVSEETTTKVK